MNTTLYDLQIGSLALFCLTAENGSFTGAAQQVGLTPAAVSRAVGRLEAGLKVRLFNRSTRKMHLTDEGEHYYHYCRQVLSQLNEAEAEFSAQQDTPSGKLKMSLPTPYAHYRVFPRLAAFREAYPDVTLDIHVSNQNVDVMAQGYDLVVRGNHVPDSGLIGRKLEDAELCIVATPGYLARYGTPETPEDLRNHECVQFELPGSGRIAPWTLTIDGKLTEYQTRGTILCRDDFLSTLSAVRYGAGLMQVYRFSAEQELQSGILTEVMKAYSQVSRPFYMLTPYSRYQPSRLRVFIRFLQTLAE